MTHRIIVSAAGFFVCVPCAAAAPAPRHHTVAGRVAHVHTLRQARNGYESIPRVSNPVLPPPAYFPPVTFVPPAVPPPQYVIPSRPPVLPLPLILPQTPRTYGGGGGTVGPPLGGSFGGPPLAGGSFGGGRPRGGSFGNGIVR